MGNRKSKSAESSIRIVLCGSLAEGYHDTKFMTQDTVYEYDLLYTLREEIHDESSLQAVPESLGYYKIFATNRSLSRLPQENEFINGYHLKQQMCSIIEKQKSRPISTTVSIDKAPIYIQDRYNAEYSKNLFDKIDYYRNLNQNEFAIARRNLKLYSKICSKILQRKGGEFLAGWSRDILNMPSMPEGLLTRLKHRMQVLTQIRGALYLSIIGIPLPSQLNEKIATILQFYHKYRHVLNTDVVKKEGTHKYNSVYSNVEEFDIVIGLKLNFRPRICFSSFERIKHKRPKLYKNIKSADIYLIPKWSEKTDNKETEFRLSFSVVETRIAQCRSKIEQMLNAVARSIYYTRLYRKDEQYVKSYVIKTIVLWMCEEFDFDEMFENETNEETVIHALGRHFVSYACTKLRSGLCEHYFIENINLLEQCNQTYLDTICQHLEDPTNHESESSTNKFYYHFCQFTANDVLFRLIQPTSEMIDEFHQIQLKYFDRISPVHMPGKFDSLLNQMFYQLYRVETDDQWWTNWKNYFLNLNMIDSNRNHNDEIDLQDVSINDIYFVLQDFAYDIQREWNSIDYLMTNNTLTRFIYYNQSSTVNYAIKICGKMLYDRNVYFLRDYALTQILFNGSLTTTTDDQKKTIQAMVKASFLKESRQIQASSLLNINESEQVSFLKAQLIEEYWLQVLPHIIMDVHELVDMGLANSGSLFSPGVNQTKDGSYAQFLRTFCCSCSRQTRIV